MDITAYKNTPTKTVDVGGARFAYRQLGTDTGAPVIFLNHLAAVLDNWDPRVVDGIAAKHRVITFDNRGVGASTGTTPDTDEPQLVRKLMLTGTGPAGGEGIDKVTQVTIVDILKGYLTFKDPKQYLFFTTTANGRRESEKFIKRLKERTEDRDTPISLTSTRAQLKAIHAWGLQEPSDLTGIRQPVLVANGEHDRMVPSSNTVDLARRLPHAQLIPLYPDAGHGGIFQYHQAFVKSALEFLSK